MNFIKKSRKKLGDTSKESLHIDPEIMPTYEALYEAHAINNPLAISVGGGDYDTIGFAELDILRYYGLKENSVLFDFGCGTGRLGKHAIEFLDSNSYFGSDISTTMLADFKVMVDSKKQYSLFHQRSEDFPTISRKLDYFAAFSVFTHMENEDSFRYLKSLKSITSRDSVVILSLIDQDSKLGRRIFLEQSSISHDARWTGVRSFCTSRESFQVIAELSGWKIDEWIHGDNDSYFRKSQNQNQFWEFGQSIVVLRDR